MNEITWVVRGRNLLHFDYLSACNPLFGAVLWLKPIICRIDNVICNTKISNNHALYGYMFAFRQHIGLAFAGCLNILRAKWCNFLLFYGVPVSIITAHMRKEIKLPVLEDAHYRCSAQTVSIGTRLTLEDANRVSIEARTRGKARIFNKHFVDGLAGNNAGLAACLKNAHTSAIYAQTPSIVKSQGKKHNTSSLAKGNVASSLVFAKNIKGSQQNTKQNAERSAGKNLLNNMVKEA